ncbi:MAG: hypothetical protein WCK39_00265 [Methanomassiliicoccales archaeon]
MRRIASIGLVALIVVAAALVGWMVTIVYPLPPPPPPGPPPNDNPWYYNANVVLSTVNTALLIAIVYIYVGIYREIKSKITLGQILVMLAFLAYAITSNPALQLAFGFRAEGLGPFAMIPDLFAAIALSILLQMSLE